ncbi:MAG: aspartate aminotransferase family protein [Gammaproteobacteria bacterium]
MSKVLHRQVEARLPRAAGGEGPYLMDARGKRYLDGCGGAAVSCLGHNHPAVVAAMRAQLDKLSYAHTAFFTTEILEALGEQIIADAPDNLTHAYFVSGGSEAVEAALKLARQYFLEIGEPQRAHFIARRQSYHGATLGALAVGGNAQRRAPYAPLLIDAAHIAPCYAYRHRRARESDAEYGLRAADELERKILELGEDRVIAFIAEPVVGATAGVVPPVEGYFRRVREICDRYGVLLILDEIMCGMGRTGALYAHAREGVRADLVTIAKGLGGGYQPIGATLLDARIHAALAAGSGAFQHGHTYLGHALAAAAALAVQQTIQREGLLDNVRQRGAELFAGLRARFEAHPHIGDIRGRGLFAGLELVAERGNKKPFAANIPLHSLLRDAAMQNGLMIYPGSGGIDGTEGHHIMLAPPFIYETAHVEELLDKLAAAMQQAFAQAGAAGR